MTMLTFAKPAFQLHSVAEVGEASGVSADTIRRAIESGELVAYKVRGQWRIKDTDITAWLARSRHQQRQSQKPRVAPFRTDYRW